jgi:fumarylacetoacetase
MTVPSDQEYWNQQSWVESANDPAVGFPLQSLPLCSFVSPGSADGASHLGVGIGEFVLDVHSLSSRGYFAQLGPEVEAALLAPQLNALARCGYGAWATPRLALSMHLLKGQDSLGRSELERHLVPQRDVRFCKPFAVGNYTDFYASMHHAENVGRLFRPDQPLLPNYKWLPIGYHGRASSLVVSGTEIRRPSGQFRLSGQDAPEFLPTAQLDYELEVGAYIGVGNALGELIPVDGIATAVLSAENHIFGLSLLNDWSARDIQSWEYQPLGPFLGKSFATSVSPWVVTMDALDPYRVPLYSRATDDPKPLPYLAEPAWMERRSRFDIKLEVLLSTAQMRASSLGPVRLSSGNLRDLYWSFGQMIAHHTSNGCNLVEGDLIASGTVSGPQETSRGCLLEITRQGASPVRLPNEEIRSFLEDGDEVILSGFCEKEGSPRISLGECRGTILPAAGAG